MSHFEFVIPVKKDELLEAQPGQYHVEDIVQPRLLLSVLQDAARAYNNEGIEYILEHFVTYFSIIVHGNKLEWNVINKGFDHIVRATKNLCNHLETILQDNEIDDDLRKKTLNIVKMTMYLFTQIMKTKDVKLAAENATKLTLGKGRKKASDNNDLCGWTEEDKQAALTVLHLVVQQPLAKLWDPPLAEDNFVSLIAEPCYKALEEQIIKNKTVREIVFQILGILIKKYNHGTACLIKLVQVLQMVEHAVSPICAGVVQLTKDFGLGTFGPQMVREIADALATSEEENPAGAAAEIGGTKNCGTFLLELTKALPKEMTTAITSLQHYLETEESYTLRISVLGMMSEALSVELTGEGLTDAQRALRDDFLDDLYDHMHDLSAYVRAKVLQFWCRLQRENCVPLARQMVVLERTIPRLKDKAALVRKAAVQLVKVFIEYNPFAGELKQNILEEQLEAETKILTDLQKKINPGPNPELIKKWEEIERDVLKMIMKNIDAPTQEEITLSDDTLENKYGAIRKLLNDKDYYKAFLIIKHVERLLPNARGLRHDMEKKEQISYLVTLLRTVFITPDHANTSFSQRSENDLAISKQLEEKENVVAFLQDAVQFCKMISQAMPLLHALLMSKLSGDVIETIDFFITAYHFNIEAARDGIANMLLLIWSTDQDKREAVERAYREMYLECDSKAERTRAFTVAKKLVALIQHIDRGSAAALGHLIGKWVEKGDVTPAVIQVLWEMYLKKIDGTSDFDSIAALSLIVMISKAKPTVAVANLEVIQQYGLTGCYKARTLSAELLLTLEKKNIRYPIDSPLFTCLFDSLMEVYSKFHNFNSFSDCFVRVIYAIAGQPDVFISKVLDEMYKKIEEATIKKTEEEVSLPAELLTRFILTLSHVAIHELIFLDITVYSELRRRNAIRDIRKKEEEIRKKEEKKKKKTGTFATPMWQKDLRRQTLMDISNSSASARIRRSGSASVSKGTSVNTTMTENDGVLEEGMADDEDAERIRTACELHVVGPETTLGRYVPLLRHLVEINSQIPEDLYIATTLALSRFMLVSSSLCEECMIVIVTALKRSKCVSLRTNITLAFADLMMRFPNLMQPWTVHVYSILRDPDVDVRLCAVRVLSYLVIHEMVRVKAQIADLALCCEDPNPHVAEVTRQFFKSLSMKGNALYNVMPDIISRLSDPELNLPEETYRNTMKYVTSLIQKDRHVESLIEKLCQRFKLSTEERQWRDLAYGLTLYTYNERSLKKLIDHLDCYKDKLYCAEVMNCFNTLIANTNKNAKNEIKGLVAELNAKIEDCFAVKDGDGDEGGKETGGEGAPPPQPATPRATPQPATPRATPRRKQAPRRNRRRSSSSPDENEQPPAEATPTPTRKSNRKAATRYNKVTSDDSDDEDFQKELFKKPTAPRTTRRRK